MKGREEIKELPDVVEANKSPEVVEDKLAAKCKVKEVVVTAVTQ